VRSLIDNALEQAISEQGNSSDQDRSGSIKSSSKSKAIPLTNNSSIELEETKQHNLHEKKSQRQGLPSVAEDLSVILNRQKSKMQAQQLKQQQQQQKGAASARHSTPSVSQKQDLHMHGPTQQQVNQRGKQENKKRHAQQTAGLAVT